VVQGGEVSFGPNATLRCPPGELFMQNVTQAPGVLDGWKINCSVVLAVLDSVGEEPLTPVKYQLVFAQPTCYQVSGPQGNKTH
jgi:hypothetical protein